MSTHKRFDKICYVVLVATLIVTILFMNGENFGVQKASTVMGYEKTLFNTSSVHSINIVMDDWDDFIENCTSEKYYKCTIIIDNEAYKNVAIRGKGNTSLTQVQSYDNNRYSFKIEFDHYDNSNTYHGLDKLCLNNIIQDNTYMKDYLTYQMMNKMGVASPLCSYAYITVNGDDWGLYLAVESIEESFLQRNYGKNYGDLYKPDSSNTVNDSNDQQADEKSFDDKKPDEVESELDNQNTQNENTAITDSNEQPNFNDQNGKNTDFQTPNQMMNSSDDVLLKYSDNNFDSYSNIFDNAKTDVSDEDKTRLIESLKNLSENKNLDETVDVDKVIRYFVVHNFVLNFDSYTGSMIHNYYLYEKDGQLQMIPWDYNLAFGGFQSMSDATSLVNYPIDSPVSQGSVEDRPMLSWIFENEEYTSLYHTYFKEFISEYFDTDYFTNMIDVVTEMISPYVKKDPTKFCTYKEFKTGVSTLKEFCSLRAESISEQLDGTIGSTSDTQDKDTLIDASGLQVSDMGTMNNASMEDMQGPQNNTNNESFQSEPNGEQGPPNNDAFQPETNSGQGPPNDMEGMPDKMDDIYGN